MDFYHFKGVQSPDRDTDCCEKMLSVLRNMGPLKSVMLKINTIDLPATKQFSADQH